MEKNRDWQAIRPPVNIFQVNYLMLLVIILGLRFSRYSAQTLNILEYAKKERCKTIVITDDPVSLLGQIADFVLIARTPYYFNSFSSTITLINCLIAGVSLQTMKRPFLTLPTLWSLMGFQTRSRGLIFGIEH